MLAESERRVVTHEASLVAEKEREVLTDAASMLAELERKVVTHEASKLAETERKICDSRSVHDKDAWSQASSVSFPVTGGAATGAGAVATPASRAAGWL